jgi:hypothetical protein
MMITDQLAIWRAEDEAAGATAAWLAAWDRARDLVSPHTGTLQQPWDMDGGAALALGLYLLAHQAGTEAADVPLTAVKDLQRPSGYPGLARWEVLLRAVGHDPEDQADPVAGRWRQVATDHTPVKDPGDDIVLDVPRQWGLALFQGLGRVMYALGYPGAHTYPIGGPFLPRS